MVVRSAMHQAGATVLSKLLRFPTPAADQRTIPCACGHQAHYRELRSKPLLTAVGKVEVLRPYYLCPHCHAASSPPMSNWTSKTRILSWGAPDAGRRRPGGGRSIMGASRLKLLADLEVTTKAVERTAEAIGEDIAAREQVEIQQAMQLDLPIIVGEAIPICMCRWTGRECPW